eukprot:CAMPEP_0177319446 /NCGR_PEP_ID=MMETSP0368-20130122/14613_1 /TAXON_ID=447022 ORGANISM="Scrippsiella hangoei-like, Strain SHHI-4" /NCGR_SAMPLE_ID=MMETSP0368 /ASSEMBLY_ACC=CAM_ASM_000363 /LENGTH=63 /DNA_ID=CAMNT_0018778945 /DNA_START=160 /DNA_END=351 /DNA_ORIENTATION=+
MGAFVMALAEVAVTVVLVAVTEVVVVARRTKAIHMSFHSSPQSTFHMEPFGGLEKSFDLARAM